jgi:hypothetical protein
MSWIFIDIDRTPISINWICLGYLSTLIELQFLSTEYVLDIYQCWYDSKFINTDRTPNSINSDMTPFLSTVIWLHFYQLNMSWIFISRNRTPISISRNMSWIFISRNRTPNSIHTNMSWISSTWYVLDVYFWKYVLDIYFQW